MNIYQKYVKLQVLRKILVERKERKSVNDMCIEEVCVVCNVDW